MADWRERALAPFVPGLARLWLAADPDGLLAEAGMVEALAQRGLDLLTFDDPASFRFAYEAGYRSHWDRGEQLDRSLVVRISHDGPGSMPYDLLQGARIVRLGLAELFPGLAYSVIATLDPGDLDAIERASAASTEQFLGENATKDFVLRHVFHVDADQVATQTDLLRCLLMLHTSGRTLPTPVADRLVQRLRQRQAAFDEWPLHELVRDRDTFIRFLQERWPRYVARWIASATPEPVQAATMRLVAERLVEYRVAGPADLELGADDIRRYVDTLFLEGLLTPITDVGGNPVHPEDLGGAWVAIGVYLDPAAEGIARLEALAERLSEFVPPVEARHQEWLSFGRAWAELIALRAAHGSELDNAIAMRITSLTERVDARFSDWMLRRYAGLYSQSGGEPAMVHHVPRVLARYLEISERARVALIVVDGLALDQWVVLRDVLREQRPVFEVHESAVFAWVPTITSVSRQAIFAGRIPLQFPGSINTTAKEPNLWRQYWAEQGISVSEVGYVLEASATHASANLDGILAQPRLRALGIVVDAVDKIMHGMQLGTAGMHNQVRQWAELGTLAALLDTLHERGFTVWITADHGNVQATGRGNPGEAALAVSRGERARIYADPILRTTVLDRSPGAIEWSPVGLPPDYFPLLAPERTAFIPFGQQRVTHGGIALEEVIVPFIRVEPGT